MGSLSKKSRRNIARFSKIQHTPSRQKYMAKHIITQLNKYINAYQEVKKNDAIAGSIDRKLGEVAGK